MIIFTIDQNAAGEWRWTLWQESHTMLAVAPTPFPSKIECIDAVRFVQTVTPHAKIFDVSSGEERLL